MVLSVPAYSSGPAPDPQIGDSVIIDQGYLEKTFAVADATLTAWTIDCWVRRSKLGVEQWIACAGTVATSLEYVRFTADDKLQYKLNVSGSLVSHYITTQVFRDTAWYNVHIRRDGTTLVIAVNGTVISLFDTADPLDATSGMFGSAVRHRLGTDYVATNNMGAIVSQFNFISGVSTPQTEFGEFDARTPTFWKFKEYTGAYGTTGFLLDFADAINLGNDVSGNGNHFASSVGLKATHQVIDRPTDPHAVLGPIGVGSAQSTTGSLTINNGNLFSSGSGTVTSSTAVSNMRMKAGKFYFEVTLDALQQLGDQYPVIGVAAKEVISPADNDWWVHTGSKAYIPNGKKSDAAASNVYGDAFTINDVIGVALDLDNSKIFFSKNGTFQNSGDPVSGTGFAYDDLLKDTTYAPFISHAGSSATACSINFGQRAFVYTPPTGFKAINRTNLLAAEGAPAIRDPSTEFVSAIDTEANIVATLAAARSGWSSYIDVFKNRSNAESWYWRFSADSSNCFNSDTIDAKEAFPTLAGSDNWVGHSFKLDGRANIKGGSVSHTNGADTTVTHNAGNARCMIILFPTLGGARPVYHPDLSSGDLLYFDATTAETADNFIKNVTANSFDIDTGKATDTYWFLVIPETAGFCNLINYAGNNLTDGPYLDTGVLPAFLVLRSLSSARNFVVFDADRFPINGPQMPTLLMNDSHTETTNAENTMDFLSRAVKLRYNNANINGSGETYVGIAIGTPAHFSNAR